MRQAEIAGTGRGLEPEDFLRLRGTDGFMGIKTRRLVEEEILWYVQEISV